MHLMEDGHCRLWTFTTPEKLSMHCYTCFFVHCTLYLKSPVHLINSMPFVLQETETLPLLKTLKFTNINIIYQVVQCNGWFSSSRLSDSTVIRSSLMQKCFVLKPIYLIKLMRFILCNKSIIKNNNTLIYLPTSYGTSYIMLMIDNCFYFLDYCKLNYCYTNEKEKHIKNELC